MYFAANIMFSDEENLTPINAYTSKISCKVLGQILKLLMYCEHLDYGAGYVIIKVGKFFSVSYYRISIVESVRCKVI